MGALDIVAKVAKGAKKAAPFFSKADEVLEELQRGKGTGQEFLTELVKKGAKPTELKERGIEAALKDKPKMSKAQVKQIFEEKAPPKVQEKVLGDAPDYDEFLEAKAQEIYGVDWFDLRKEEQRALEKMYGDLPSAQYEQYKTPGGENYREILLKLPQAKSEREIADENLKAFTDRVTSRIGKTGWDFDSMTPEELIEYDYLNKAALSASQTKPLPYASSHWRGEPNVLAHIRVQDFQVPSRGFAVVNTRSGNKSQVFPTMEEAQAFMAQMPESLQGMLRIDEAAGKPKKVLLVDEIQSDWHQEGRKKGYKTAESLENWYNQNKLESDPPFAELNPDQINVLERNRGAGMGGDNSVPDAPFKKNWHELAMKRVLDYAAENGYDTVAITPGAEQAKRYDLSKQVDNVEVSARFGPDGAVSEYDVKATPKGGGRSVFNDTYTADKLPDLIGKELAEKIVAEIGPRTPYKSYAGIDLQVGGEGMKGFYDKILPDYLNTYGKQYGAKVGELQLPAGQEMSRGPSGTDMVPTYTPIMQNFHSFDITPQMREAIKTKGQPLYSAMGAEGLAAGTGAATIGADALSGNNEQPVQNPVHFTENPDAMLLEMMQRN